ncbi:hypothetical protein CANARDRAFT_30768, partial [[Candida] arabinofermentans NRRL YB-2248]
VDENIKLQGAVEKANEENRHLVDENIKLQGAVAKVSQELSSLKDLRLMIDILRLNNLTLIYLFIFFIVTLLGLLIILGRPPNKF